MSASDKIIDNKWNAWYTSTMQILTSLAIIFLPIILMGAALIISGEW